MIETPAGSLDLRSFQSLIRRLLGKKIIQISGEITTRKESGQEFLRLRLRQTPGREVLIDFETSRGTDDLFKKAALNLLEHVDPEVAAGIYFRTFNDPENAMRLIAIALAGGHPGSEKYALNLQSYVVLARGQIDDAMNASDKARSLDPNFWAAYISKVWVLMALKRYDEALEVAKFAIDLSPDNYNGYRNLGAVFKAMGRAGDAIEAFRTTLRLNNRDVSAYRLLAATLRGEGRTKEASETLFTAVALAPDDPQVQFDYGEDLIGRGRHHEALGVLCKVYETLPDNIRFQIACAEARFFVGQNAEGINLATTVKKRISSGETIPENLKARAETLTARIPQVDQQR